MSFRDKPETERSDIYNRLVNLHPNRIPCLLYPTERTALNYLKNEK